MSGRPGWFYSALLIVAANLFPLAGWWWNRTGDQLAAVELSEQEAAVVRGGEDDSSVRLRLQLGDPWLAGADSSDLVAIGFDADLLTTGDPVPLPPRRPPRRPAWVLLRVDDPATARDSAGEWRGSRLHPVGLGTNPGELYRRAGDRADHLVMRGVVRLSRVPVITDSVTGAVRGETWSASVDLVTPPVLHVPKSLVSTLERLAPTDRPAESPRFQVRLSMGRLQLPRVTEVLPMP